MKKKFWIMIFCLICSFTFAETIGNVEVAFPPSYNDWVVLFEHHNIDEDNGKEQQVSILTHREGDALEVFVVLSTNDSQIYYRNKGVWEWEEDEYEEEKDTKESIQNEINEMICQFFPNHSYQITTFIDEKDHGFCEWELNDGKVDIMHGVSRHLETEKCMNVFGYFSTSEKTEANTALWHHIINNAKILD